MVNIITDLKEIERISNRKRDQNYDFRSYMKGYLDWSDEELDRVVLELYEEVSAQVDCTACRNCCRVAAAEVEPEEMERIAGRLGISAEDFKSQYFKTNDYGEKVFFQIPCPLLDGCACSIFDDRPANCRNYPYIQNGEVRSRSIGFIENSAICPIAFNVLERLKERVNWRPRRR